MQGGCDDVQGGAGLVLYGVEEGVWRVRFREEGVDFGVAEGDYAG